MWVDSVTQKRVADNHINDKGGVTIQPTLNEDVAVLAGEGTHGQLSLLRLDLQARSASEGGHLLHHLLMPRPEPNPSLMW